MSDEELHPLPSMLPSLSDELREASRALQEGSCFVPQKGTIEYESWVLEMASKSQVVRQREEIKLRNTLKKQEKRREALKPKKRKVGRPKLHYMKKRARVNRYSRMRLARDYRTDLKTKYSCWKRRPRTAKEGAHLSLEDYAFIWDRIYVFPHKKTKEGKPVRMWLPEMRYLRMDRKDVKLPWTLDNIEPYLTIRLPSHLGKKRRRKIHWETLERAYSLTVGEESVALAHSLEEKKDDDGQDQRV